MLKEVKINESTADNEELKQMYDSAFPGFDQMLPYDQMIHIGDFINADLVAYYDKDILVGMTIVFVLPRFNFGVYFTVKEGLRNKGYGKKILDILFNKYSKDRPFIIGAQSPFQKDAPNLEIRKRRYSFFQRCGFRDTGVTFTDISGTYVMMSSSNEPFTQKDCDELFELVKEACEKSLARK